ncbi:hypothetical protein N7499_004669 [Penicillium canescens]|uniref:Transcription initiation factor TFIID subunit 2 n=1 Tax=Penicillium canescens TaxID=5083 RepID=A0AAD6I1P2_PENCN|nr:hypothetical protein N7522_004946 [Penicillium canescens]KAJ6026565.1 hypothetical protein N7460_011382 [Penicillium canescens]KAJ6039849.1 hypothetical protein N7444_008754 [Penicillium canescens]KAJ6085040.1 hypothetical protein N7499_004669 [Penicillium canescens]KAJ6161826.1 hypothetical protein N7485_010056 [Penicillium canescens]
MPGIVDTPVGAAAPAWDLGFSVGHQKVELDIDLASKSLKGNTEITIHPHRQDLGTIWLNFRQGEIKRLSVNGKQATAKYSDPYESIQLYGPHYHERLVPKLDSLLQTPPKPTLAITIPKNVRIEELDPSSAEAQDQIALQSTAGDVDGPGGSRAQEATLPRFAALTVNLEFAIDSIRDGLQVVGVEHGDRRYPHAYTTNSLESGIGCPLFPCVDDTSSRCTWEFSITCPSSLGGVFDRKSKTAPGSTTPSRSRPQNPQLSADDEGLDMSVVCSGDLTDDIVDPKDPSRKTVSFASYSPLGAQQIGFAIGPFEYVNLADFRESDQDEQLGQNAIPLHAFCLPGRADEVQNTSFPMAQAIDFFSLSYGSYPFASYKICFVDDVPTDSLPTACMSICSNHLLFPAEMIDPMYESTRTLVHGLACQWSGINIIPNEPADTWVTVGVAWYITDTFMKHLCGNNEYRFRLKQMSDRVCELDFERPSIYDMGNILKVDPSEYRFVALKAPLVLWILDRRLTKASGKPTMSRIVTRLFLNSRMGDMPNGAVTSSLFQKTCERLGHAKLDVFFQQWVYGAGCPRFTASQRFNKKKLVVEMMIRQVQAEQQPPRDLEKDTFLRDVKEEVRHVYAGAVQPVFTGSMTLRIHEADGTPYEHIVEIKEGVTKFDIPYNTKYKRLKRNKKQRERAVASGDAEVQEEVLLYCLGDVLQTEEEAQSWRLADWTKEDEERMGQESYEWIRMDADFEWICKLSLGMPGYMYLSQLQQDRDVVAQLESLQYMAAQREHPLISTIFVRTLMDSRYFHGIRVTAARALVKHAKDEVDWVGLYHLETAFQELFCLPGSPMTRSNDFSDRAAYILQQVIPDAISKVRDNSGKTPLRVKRFLFDKLKFNDNSNNEYSDNFYVASLMKSLCHAMLGRNESRNDEELDHFDMERVLETQAEEQLEKDAIAEFDRYRRMDEWSSSFQNLYSRAALHCQAQLMQAKIIDVDLMRFLPYTRAGTYDLLRIQAFQCLVDLDIGQSPELLRWLMYTLSTDSSAWIRHQSLGLLGQALAQVAFGRPEQPEGAQTDGLIIEQESTTEVRRDDIARRQTIPGAIEALKRELSLDGSMKEYMWAACNSPTMNVLELSELTDLCRVLYDPITSKLVRMRLPRYWNVKNLGHGKLHFTKSSTVRMGPSKGSSKRKREEGMPPPSTRITFKTSKTGTTPSTPSATLPKLHIPNPSATPSATPRTPAASTTPTPASGGPLKLKLKFGSRPT